MFWNKINIANWRSPTILIFIYGILKELRLSDPYKTPFLSNVRNFTEEEVLETIFPERPTAVIALAAIVFLISDGLLYRPFIVLQAISCIIYAILLIFVNDHGMLKIIVEIFNGLLISCDVAYFTYLYAIVPIDQYPIASALSRVAHLFGGLLSGLVGHALISAKLLDYLQLQYISVATGCLSLVAALALPKPQGNLFFRRKDDNASQTPTYMQVLSHIKNGLRSAYTQYYVVAWSVWWAIASCVFWQVMSYVQFLWISQTDEENDLQWNGFAEAAQTLLATGACWLATRLVLRHPPWKAWVAIAIFCTIYSTLLISLAISRMIVFKYILYIAFNVLYATTMTVTSFEIAQNISRDSTALIFGFNTSISLVLQAILATFVTSTARLNLPIQYQMVLFGAVYGYIATNFAILAFICYFKKPKQRNVQT